MTTISDDIYSECLTKFKWSKIKHLLLKPAVTAESNDRDDEEDSGKHLN